MPKPNGRTLAIMVAVLLAATFLRLVAWRAAPPGLRFDEMLVVTQTDDIRNGARPIYLDDLAEEPLYHYLFAAAQDLFGEQLFTLRWLSMALSLIAVAALYALGRRLFNGRVGVLAAALAAASFWALMYSRVGLRIIALPAFVTLAMVCLWRGLTHARRRDFVIAALLFDLSAYTYSATRMLPLIFMGFGLYLFIFHRATLRRHVRNLTLMVVLAVILALPLAVHLATVPVAERRLGEVSGPLTDLRQGNVTPLINSTLITAAMFIAKGDPEWLYNLPDRPVFDPIVGVIFYGAVLLSLRRVRRAPYALVVIWLVVGLLPCVLTWPAASNSHSILAQSAVFLIAAVGLDALATRILSGVSRFSETQSKGAVTVRNTGRLVEIAFISSVLIIHSAVSINDYFNRWATHPTVRAEHQAVETAYHFAQHPVDEPLVFSSGSVTHWNPWALTTFRLNVPPGYTNARWFDARSSFIFPLGKTDLTLITPALDDTPAPLDARLIEDLFPVVEPSPLSTAYFKATHLVSSLNTRLITLTQASVSWPDGSAARLPLAFNDRLELIGYDLRRTTIPIGRNIRLTTYWRAQRLARRPVSIFVHVLDEQGNLDAQWDGLTIAPEYVQTGDIIVQVHFIPIPPGFAPGTYQLALGMYYPREDQQPRLPIMSEGQSKADRILLQSVTMINDQ